MRPGAQPGNVPVSYTHLDVYKRQPMACSLFGISDDISMQVVAVGFIIGVIQDSVETALNSSSDLLLSASAEFRPVSYTHLIRSLIF